MPDRHLTPCPLIGGWVGGRGPRWLLSNSGIAPNYQSPPSTRNRGGAQVVPPTPAPCTTVLLPRGNWTYYDGLCCPHHLKREILPNGRTWSFVPRDRPLSLESAVMGFADHSFSSSPSSSSPLSSSLSLSYWIFEERKCTLKSVNDHFHSQKNSQNANLGLFFLLEN